ncbi:MAG: M6 family metalloprotease domain-containing protein [Lentisphaerae bacterium]|nr:M6 family metalloprotease domain-containing protein [Lentisphaerota bacterium]
MVTRRLGFLLVLSLGLCMPRQSAAMQASPHPFEARQPDGATLHLTLHGDERFHWLEDEHGYTTLRENGRYVYARRDTGGHLVATPLVVGRDDPAAAGLTRRILPAPAVVRSLQSSALPAPSESVPGPEAVQPNGTVKNVVILMRFSNHTTRTLPSVADVDTIFNAVGGDPVLAPSGSVRDLYLENSYGAMTINSTVFAWVTLPNTETYYANGQSGLSTKIWEAITAALNLADPLINFSQFDADADGKVDAIAFVHSGYAAEWGGTDSSGTYYTSRIWSHRWSIPTWTSAEGIKVSAYHINPALWGTSGTSPGRIGVICHETGHFFGLPDLYDTDGGGEGIGSYCMMANSWGFSNDQLHPPHFSAWSKIFLGWITPTVLSAPGVYAIPQAETSPAVFRINQGFPSTEYLLVENREPVGFESTMPAGGLAVWHVDEAKAGNTAEGYPGQAGWPANNNHYKVALLQADGLYQLERGQNRGDSGDLYRASGVSAITPTTVPSTVSYQNGVTTTTRNQLTDIGVPGASMTFTYSLTSVLTVSPTNAFDSAGAVGGPFIPSSQVCVLTNRSASSITWTATRSQPWLSLSPTNGVLAAGAVANVTLSINSAANALAPGAYADAVLFTNLTNAGDFTTHPVSLAVASTTTTTTTTSTTSSTTTTTTSTTSTTALAPPQLFVSPPALDFGAVPVGQVSNLDVVVTNAGGQPLSGTVSVLPPFALATNAFIVDGGSATAISVTFTPPGVGNYSNDLEFTSDGGQARCSVSGTGTPIASLALSPSTLFVAVRVGNAPTAQTFDVWNATTGTLAYAVSSDAAWLSATPAGGSSTGEHDPIAITCDTTLLTPDRYTGTLTISATEALDSPQTVTVTLDVLAPQTHFVSSSSTTPVPPYTNWTTAAQTIQDAVDVSEDGDTVLVTNGTYNAGGRIVFGALSNRVAITRAVTVQSVGGPAVTRISGQGPNGNSAVRGAYVSSGAALIGFTLSDGATRTTGDAYKEQSGGGVWCAEGGVVSNCVVTGNTAARFGAGAAYGTLYRCTVSGNQAASYGGGSFFATLVNCRVAANSAFRGGGTYYGTNVNCTIVTNVATHLGGGTYVGASVNCIIFGNTASNALYANYSSGAFAYTCTGPAKPAGSGNVTNDPLFVNAPAGDYRLRPFSPALDSGTNLDGMADGLDLAGNARLVDGNEDGTSTVDLGAYEFQLGTVYPQTRYVDAASASPAAPYVTWATAAREIQDAVDIANEGDTILVTNGLYNTGGRTVFGALSNRVAITKAVVVQSVGGPSVTQIAGQGPNGSSAVRCAYVTSGAALIGFTLRDGATRTTGDAYREQSGGGVWCAEGGVVSNCVIAGNSAARFGGGAAYGQLYACVVSGNRADSYGGGAFYAALWNSLVASNSAIRGGGTYYATNVNGTIVANTATHLGGGTYVGSSMNCIIFGNTASNAVYANYSSGTFAFSCTGPVKPIGPGNFNSDPQFANAPAGSFRLDPSSPAIDAGTNQPWMTGDTDLDGHARLVDGNQDGATTVDVGAYEVQLEPAVPQTRYVDAASATPAAPYLDWTTAARTIQDALDVSLDGDTILVTNGVYNSGGRVVFGTLANRVAITRAIVVRSVGGPDVTHIVGQGPNGNSAVRGAYLANGAALIGFTLRGGATRTLGDAYREQSGGGVWCADGGVVSNCVITGNTAARYGGGAAYGTLYRCTVSGNQAANYGGGTFFATAWSTLMTANSAPRGGGTYYGTNINCTIVTNSASYLGGGTYVGSSVNGIVCDNSASNAASANYSSGTFAYTCTGPVKPAGIGNITNDPQFINALAGDFRLAASSPALDAGINQSWMTAALDLDGQARLADGNADGSAVVDLGAYEAPVPLPGVGSLPSPDRPLADASAAPSWRASASRRDELPRREADAVPEAWPRIWASSSAGPQHPPANLLDGNTNTCWIGQPNASPWRIIVDLGHVTRARGLDVRFVDPPWSNMGVVGSADALTWFAVSGSTNTLAPVRHFYLNLWTDDGATNPPAIREIILQAP